MLLLKIMIPRVFIFVCDISQCMGCVCVGGGGGGGGGRGAQASLSDQF